MVSTMPSEQAANKVEIRFAEMHSAIAVMKVFACQCRYGWRQIGQRHCTRQKSWHENGMDKTRSWRIGKCYS